MPTLTAEQVREARAMRDKGATVAALAERYGVHRTTMLRHTKRVVRPASDFQQALSVAPPTRKQPSTAWDLELIRAARDDQMAGTFERPVRLAEAVRTNDAIFVAYHNRIAPIASVAAKLQPADNARGRSILAKASKAIVAERAVLQGILGTMVNHGLAIGYVERSVNRAGTLVSMRLTEWPLEFVRWDASRNILMTSTREGWPVPIHHADGNWIVFSKFDDRPWTQDACILPIAFVWPAHANGVRDWAAGSTAHGLAKVLGELPEGQPLQEKDGSLTPAAQAFLQVLQDVFSGDSPAGIKPSGAKAEYVSNNSTAWQIFKELILSREKAAARIYQGTDAALGSAGGAPGVDIATLFGVASTRVQSDLEAIERGLRRGLYEPWTAINTGSTANAPSLVFELPDPDAQGTVTERRDARAALHDTIERMRETGLAVDQATVNALAAEFGVKPAPVLAAAPAPAPAPTA